MLEKDKIIVAFKKTLDEYSQISSGCAVFSDNGSDGVIVIPKTFSKTARFRLYLSSTTPLSQLKQIQEFCALFNELKGAGESDNFNTQFKAMCAFYIRTPDTAFKRCMRNSLLEIFPFPKETPKRLKMSMGYAVIEHPRFKEDQHLADSLRKIVPANIELSERKIYQRKF